MPSLWLLLFYEKIVSKDIQAQNHPILRISLECCPVLACILVSHSSAVACFVMFTTEKCVTDVS